ncbi:chemotaxis protein CheA [Mobiluncus curtisii]|uniref:histidine kinase n=1 Tax=Mobiluncus curtisii TaxID=2051 RepID=A0A7Y0UHB2_9ACTO|nr:chemotaxis protein CheA [Mobiluncus curtisii]MCU9986511.1 chemotaxis protein CheA [Mobiluncus curtisii]MCV0000226.1 chemotaxis protein CheA [Mobiluncus curtisii]NMW48797.1 chemotaxis protein CheA [Mobiluncus curtisii]NMW87248.1 chemotaxis protein CheA [Mobiluncus curtisii]NMX12929.1 chemotaxis protein CheA [Mobiluncus curtisii]
MGEMDEIVREFLVESYENLDQLEQDMVSLESEPGSKELLSSIFRTIHTIKGTSGFLAFNRLEKLAHRGENLLSELRDGVREMDQETADVLLLMVDRIRNIMGSVEETGQEGDVDIESVIAQIEAIQGKTSSAPLPAADGMAGEPAPAEAAAPAADAPVEVPFLTNVADENGNVNLGEDLASAPAAPAADAPAEVPFLTNVADENGNVNLGDGAAEAAAPAPAETAAPAAQAAPAAKPEPPAPAAPKYSLRAAKKDDAKPAEHGSSRSAADSSIRVDVDLLDVLMREVSELVLVRNQIVRLTDSMTDMNLVQSSQRLSIVATELQEGIMKTRMQPIEHLWSKMPRVVRDLAKQTEKNVQLVMIGGDTELDRSLLEAIKDPLTHMVRNAVDHGVESPEARKAAGKDPKGTVTLKAYHAGGQVVVDIIDDGAGIDPVVVANKALDKGLVTQQQLGEMSDKEIFNLLFLPGFSTAKKVSNISGRGVGTDVVKTSVEAIGGTVDVESELGKGSTWRMRIPLTLAIQPSLTVESHGELYAIPQVSLLELVVLDSSRKETSMEYVNASPVYRLRGMLLPLIRLSHVLHPEEASDRGSEANGVIAVLQNDDQRFGLVVDKVINNEEIVVKPLSSKLKSIGLYAGATLLGDGRVALILDIGAVARKSLTGATTQAAQKAQMDAEAAQARSSEMTGQALVVGIGDGRRVAIPLAAVTRLEHISVEAVERVGGREVIQYRGQILPIVRLDRLLGVMDYEEPKDLQVVVYRRGERSVAMVVREILDIVADDKRKHSNIEDHGLLGSAVLKDRVTELLDVEQAVRAADPTFFDEIEDFNAELEMNSRLDMVGA